MESSLAKLFKKSSMVGKQAADFFSRHTLEVARDLLGARLAVRDPQSGMAQFARIVEVEAYRAGDPASHSARGITPRSRVMFGPPGHAYVYLIYGMYRMLNFVTEPEGKPGAVLIRGVEIEGSSPSTAAGPGRLTNALGILMSDNGLPLSGPRFEVALPIARSSRRQVGSILVSPRVGIQQGQDRLWRFWIGGTEALSRAPQNAMAIPLTAALWKQIRAAES